MSGGGHRLGPAALAVAALFALSALTAPETAAQGLALDDLGNGDQPVTIDAENGIEWNRNEATYIARGNASAKRGEVTVYGDTLTALYRETPAGRNEVYRLVAEGNVKIVSTADTAYGDHAVYDVGQAVLVMTGNRLRLVSANGTVTARDAIEYWQQKQMAVARGNAVAVKDKDTLKGDTLVAHFVKGPDGKNRIQRLDGYGNVVVLSGEDEARGDRGTYHLDSGVATLVDNVRLKRGKSELVGQYGEMNTRTGISRLLPAPPGTRKGPRVSGVLVPPPKGGETPGDQPPATGP